MGDAGGADKTAGGQGRPSPTPGISDRLVERSASGDDGALEALLRAVQPELLKRVSIKPSLRRSLSEEDVLQVSYLEAFLRIQGLEVRTVAGFKAWMGRVVDNNLRDAIRGLEREKRVDVRRRETVGSEGESARTLLARLSGDDPTVGAGAVLREEVDRLREVIVLLPATYRLVVEQLDLAEKPVAEVAEELGRSRGAVHLLRSRAHQRLRELLRKPGAP